MSGIVPTYGTAYVPTYNTAYVTSVFLCNHNIYIPILTRKNACFTDICVLITQELRQSCSTKNHAFLLDINTCNCLHLLLQARVGEEDRTHCWGPGGWGPPRGGAWAWAWEWGIGIQRERESIYT